MMGTQRGEMKGDEKSRERLRGRGGRRRGRGKSGRERGRETRCGRTTGGEKRRRWQLLRIIEPETQSVTNKLPSLSEAGETHPHALCQISETATGPPPSNTIPQQPTNRHHPTTTATHHRQPAPCSPPTRLIDPHQLATPTPQTHMVTQSPSR